MDIRLEEPKDAVNHPSHYTFGEIEVIDYIRDKLTPEEFQGYCLGNVMKYISRWRHKGGAEDLNKARVYLNWAIESANAKELYAKSNEVQFSLPLTRDYVNPDLNRYPHAGSSTCLAGDSAK